MISLKLAYKNLIGAGLRTWLNVIVLSFCYILIIWYFGLLDGWNKEARRETINWEIGGGQFWQKNYDPFDPLTLNDSHSPIPEALQSEIASGHLTPILVAQATIYPEGRIQNVVLKGIDPEQKILKIPSAELQQNGEAIPALIGTRMAKTTKLNVGDLVTVRWRDADGTFDAADIKIVGIFKTIVPAIDNGQLWLPLERLQTMLGMSNEATILVTAPTASISASFPDWEFKNHEFLLRQLSETIRMKSVGIIFVYVILLLLAMLAVFDTQVLSIFRRQKEIGTIIALGMTRWQVVRLFTVEGAMYGVLAAIVAAAYGIPLLTMQAIKGIPMPQGTDEYGLTIAEKIFPVYSAGLIAATVAIVFITATIVSFLPARKIAKMNPTEAIKGKIQ
ncbi:MAG: FtsX-like permease family protein [candidate division KSB1 bacterium]|nr:FtsX-like permease family protein [candidate division KSB1 bacterium]